MSEALKYFMIRLVIIVFVVVFMIAAYKLGRYHGLEESNVKIKIS